MIVRGPRPTANFTVLDNTTVIRNSRLSWKARGLLAYLLSLPDGWKTSSAQLARVGPDGRDAILSGLSELEAAGFIRRRLHRQPDGTVRTVTIVFDRPQPVDNSTSPESGNPESVNPDAKEELTINDVVKDLRGYLQSVIHNERDQAECDACDGTGWTPTPDGNLEKCMH